METVYKRRLLKLARFLEELPKHKFNLDVIVEDEKVKNTGKLPSLEHGCGTAACAIGWTPVVFPTLVKYEQEDCCVFVKLRSDDDKYDFLAAEKLFNINRRQAEYLFCPHTYPDKQGNKTVAKRIIEFVESDGVINNE